MSKEEKELVDLLTKRWPRLTPHGAMCIIKAVGKQTARMIATE